MNKIDIASYTLISTNKKSYVTITIDDKHIVSEFNNIEDAETVYNLLYNLDTFYREHKIEEDFKKCDVCGTTANDVNYYYFFKGNMCSNCNIDYSEHTTKKGPMII